VSNVILSNFQPRRRLISAVTLADQSEITTTEAHGYEVDQLVRIIIPDNYGMKVDYEIAKIKTVPSTTTFTSNLNTSSQSAFVAPTEPPSFTQAHIVPITGNELNDITIFG
jgi:hypothetical protein